MKKLVSMLCMIFLVLLPIIVIGEDDSILTNMQSEWTITSKEETIIPIDYKGVDYGLIGHKAANDKYFLYYIDEKGIHILPIAAGNAKLTLTNKENKKDKINLNIIITEDAVYPANEPSPLRAFIVFNETKSTKWDDSGKYVILGGSGKYEQIRIAYEGGDYIIRTSSNDLLKKNSGTFKSTLRHDHLYDHAVLTVRDSAGNEISAVSQTVYHDIPLLVINPYYYSVNFDKPIIFNYTVIGGVPPYKFEIDCMNDKRFSLYKNKLTSKEQEGSLKLEIKNSNHFIAEIIVTDKNKTFINYNYINYSPITDDKTIGIKADKIQVKPNEEVVFSIFGDEILDLDNMKISFQLNPEIYGFEPIELPAKRDGDNYIVTSEKPGAICVVFYSNTDNEWRSGVMCYVEKE